MAKEGSVAPRERVNIVYKPALGDAQEEKELPLKMLVMGDFTQRQDNRPLEERKPINIDKDNFNDVMKAMNLKVAFNAKNVLTPNAGWNWNQVIAAVPEVANAPRPDWLTQGVNGRQVLINTPEYPRKTLFDTPPGFLQPRVGVSFALDDKTVLHGYDKGSSR